jgi:hypothetical protein
MCRKTYAAEHFSITTIIQQLKYFNFDAGTNCYFQSCVSIRLEMSNSIPSNAGRDFAPRVTIYHYF